MNAPLLPGGIELSPLTQLKPYARNAKTHDPDQVAKIAASMVEFGWTVPVLVAAEGELIVGHERLVVGRSVPCLVGGGCGSSHATQLPRWIQKMNPS